MRGLGLPSLLADLLGPLVVLFALVTQLGDAWFLTVLVALTYWVGPWLPRVGHAVDRRRGAVLVGLLLLSFTIVTVGKPLFGLPRPPGAEHPPRADLVPVALREVYAWLSTGSGFGFPSGHATGATLVYGGLAWAIRVGSARQRAALAAGMVVLVSLSRLVLGLHYLVDVLAGAAIGLVGLALAVRLRKPGRVFGLTAGLAVTGLVVVGPNLKLFAVVGTTVGATLSWLAVSESLPTDPSVRSRRLTVAIGAVTVGPLLGAAIELQTVAPVVVGLGAAGGGLLVAMPLIGDSVAKKI